MRRMPRRAVSQDEPREGTLDMLMARGSAVRRRLGNLDKVSVDYIEASGDCFYLAVESALSESDGWCPYYAVATQRDVVASSMTEETYQMYALMHNQQAEGEQTAPMLRARHAGSRKAACMCRGPSPAMCAFPRVHPRQGSSS